LYGQKLTNDANTAMPIIASIKTATSVQ